MSVVGQNNTSLAYIVLNIIALVTVLEDVASVLPLKKVPKLGAGDKHRKGLS